MGIPERWKRFRPLPPKIKELLESLSPFFQERGIILAYLFGSLSHNEKANDIDLAVLLKNDSFSQLREELVEILGTERLDLVNLKKASPLIRFQIISKGKLLYAASEGAVNQFELSTLREYRDTHPLRKAQRDYLRRRFAHWLSKEK